MADASVVACATSTSADDGAVLVLDAPPPDLTPSSRRGKKHLPKEAYDILKGAVFVLYPMYLSSSHQFFVQTIFST